MGALANAVALMESDEMRKWCMAASVFQARKVITEAGTVNAHATRLKLADAVVTNPNLYATRFVNVVATDPQVASAGDTPAEVTESTVIAKVEEVWTPLATLLFN